MAQSKVNPSLLYIRVSSKEQEKEGYSLDAQEKLGEEYALQNNLKIIKRWRVSESAWGEDRISFSEMLEYAKKHDDVKHIIFDVTDRMTRNNMDKIKIYTLIKLYDKTIHFSRSNKTISKDSGSEDEFMLDIEVAVAKKMSNDISRKTQMGMLEKAEQGLYPSSAPLGYINNALTKLLEVDTERAPHIKRTFELIAYEKHSLSMVSAKLYKEGFRSAKGYQVNKSSISHLLNNPIYYGAFRWKGKIYQGSHEPIVSKELFDKTHEAISGPSRPSANKNGFPFNNLITCGMCDCKVLGERKKEKYIYYHCTFSKGRHKGKHYISQDNLSAMFEPIIKQVTLPKELTEWLKEALREHSKSTHKLQENRLHSLEKQHERVNTRLSKLYDMKLDGEVLDDMFAIKDNEYKSQLIELKSQDDAAKNINSNAYEDGCKTLELSNRLHPLYVRANYQEKAKLASLVSSNYTLNDVTLSPTYRKPFSFFTKRASRSSWLPRLDSNQE